jgi:hypothetical protein
LHILGGRPADALHDDGGVGLEDDAVVDDFVDGEGYQVVVLDDGSLVDGLPGVAGLVAKGLMINWEGCKRGSLEEKVKGVS